MTSLPVKENGQRRVNEQQDSPVRYFFGSCFQFWNGPGNGRAI